MHSAFKKVSNLKVNEASKIAITLASSTINLYAFGQGPIFKIFLQSHFLFQAKINTYLKDNSKTYKDLL